MRTELVSITPGMAEAYLGKNIINRNVSERLVNKYAEDMANGNWGLTHQGIAFYADGTLADGQHRLCGIIKSGKTIKMLVTTGVKKETSIDIDAGRPRSIIDGIKIGGLSEWIEARHVAMIKLIAAPKSLSTTEIINWLNGMADSAKFSTGHLATNKRNLTNSAIHAAVALAHFYEGKSDELAHFCKVFLNGFPESKRDEIIIRLRDDFFNNPNGGGSGKRDRYFKAMRAIQIYLNEEKIKRLVLPQEAVWTYDGDAQ
jgi:hypothetical protein